jgi:hypothetical protein
VVEGLQADRRHEKMEEAFVERRKETITMCRMIDADERGMQRVARLGADVGHSENCSSIVAPIPGKRTRPPGTKCR